MVIKKFARKVISLILYILSFNKISPTDRVCLLEDVIEEKVRYRKNLVGEVRAVDAERGILAVRFEEDYVRVPVRKVKKVWD